MRLAARIDRLEQRQPKGPPPAFRVFFKDEGEPDPPEASDPDALLVIWTVVDPQNRRGQ